MEKNKPLCYTDLKNLIKTFELVAIDFDDHNEQYGHYLVINCNKYLADTIKEKSGLEVRLISGNRYFGSYMIDHIEFTGF